MWRLFFHLQVLVALTSGHKTVYLRHLDCFTVTALLGTVTVQLPTRYLEARFLHGLQGSRYQKPSACDVVTVQLSLLRGLDDYIVTMYLQGGVKTAGIVLLCNFQLHLNVGLNYKCYGSHV